MALTGRNRSINVSNHVPQLQYLPPDPLISLELVQNLEAVLEIPTTWVSATHLPFRSPVNCDRDVLDVPCQARALAQRAVRVQDLGQPRIPVCVTAPQFSQQAPKVEEHSSSRAISGPLGHLSQAPGRRAVLTLELGTKVLGIQAFETVRGGGPVISNEVKPSCETSFSETTMTEAQRSRFKELVAAWDARSATRKALVSRQYQDLQRRFLYLSVLDAPEFIQQFDLEKTKRSWSGATAALYFVAALEARETIGMIVEEELRLKAKLLTYEEKEEDGVRPTLAATPQQIQQAATFLQPQHAAALLVSFELGQRLGDCLNLFADKVQTFLDPQTRVDFVALTFVKGKTTRRRDPYTLHMPLHTQAGQAVHSLVTSTLQTKQSASKTKSPTKLLFGPKQAALLAIRQALKQVHNDLSILSVRRGGLQRMALGGCSVACLMHHSRHADETMLNRYLQWGLYNLEMARERYSKETVRRL